MSLPVSVMSVEVSTAAEFFSHCLIQLILLLLLLSADASGSCWVPEIEPFADF